MEPATPNTARPSYAAVVAAVVVVVGWRHGLAQLRDLTAQVRRLADRMEHVEQAIDRVPEYGDGVIDAMFMQRQSTQQPDQQPDRAGDPGG